MSPKQTLDDQVRFVIYYDRNRHPDNDRASVVALHEEIRKLASAIGVDIRFTMDRSFEGNGALIARTPINQYATLGDRFENLQTWGVTRIEPIGMDFPRYPNLTHDI